MIATLPDLPSQPAHRAHQSTVVASSFEQTAEIAYSLEKSGVSETASLKAAQSYVWAQKQQHNTLNHNRIAFVDFSLPSNQKRLYVLNISNGQLEGKYYVGHGKNSGNLYATHFSNKRNSRQSSLGAFRVGDIYHGKHGRSEHIHGMEKGRNDLANERYLAIHRASYVTPSYIKKHKRAGRSWGCFALNPQKADHIMNQLPAGTFLYAYADTSSA